MAATTSSRDPFRLPCALFQKLDLLDWCQRQAKRRRPWGCWSVHVSILGQAPVSPCQGTATPLLKELETFVQTTSIRFQGAKAIPDMQTLSSTPFEMFLCSPPQRRNLAGPKPPLAKMGHLVFMVWMPKGNPLNPKKEMQPSKRSQPPANLLFKVGLAVFKHRARD